MGIPISGIILALSSRTCFCSDMWAVRIREWPPKRPFFGDRRVTRDFHKISGNRGKSTAVSRGRISNPTRGWECPIFVTILPIKSMTCFVPTFRQFLFAIRYREWPFLETDEWPSIFIKFRQISDKLPLLDEALFGPLIAAGNSAFSAPF